MYLAVLGSHPSLSLAELISLHSTNRVKSHNQQIATVDTDQLNLDHLGGTVKLAKLKTELATTNLKQIQQQLLQQLADYCPPRPGKLTFGVSIYGSNNLRAAREIGLAIKQQLKKTGQAARYLPNKSPALSSAQVWQNQLTDRGVEIIVAVGRRSTLIGVTTAVQDIAAYSKRDYERPRRDARVGMLPPKLAQIMINLANPAPGATILDPFCGTGVVLQEALLAGYKASGNDLEPRMVDYTTTNLEWIIKKYAIASNMIINVGVADARSARFPTPVDAVVSEVYLGPPLSRLPAPPQLEQIRRQVDTLLVDFLKNLAAQLKTGTPVCLAIPVWQTKNGLLRLPIVDRLPALGYTYKDFTQPFRNKELGDLIYRRPDAVVGRQLIVVIKK